MREELCVRRRAMLAGIGGVSLLAACGSDEPEPAAQSAQGQPSASASAEIAETAQVPVGGGIVVGGLLVVQPDSGSFKAFDAACPHKGVLVAAPENGVATCPAHKSTFSIKDGAKIAGPTPSGLKEVAIKVDGARIMRS
jgi:nitrite reductase/ring-hydroxylating ferredoxin subunit